MSDEAINDGKKPAKKKSPDELTIALDMDEETSLGIYSNLVLSNYSKEEFFLDFAFLQPQMRKGKVRSRIILSPKNAKRLLHLLAQNIKDFESKCGPIDDPLPPQGIKFSFN